MPLPASAYQGSITRGTTNPNRLRRVDRYAAFLLEPVLRHESDHLVVDLGFGGSAATPREMHQRLRRIAPRVRTLGLEIDPERVAAALPFAGAGLDFARGGFEVRTPGAERPVLVRAYNVLRQYDEAEVAAAWALIASRLAPDGFLIEGTCDEIGRTAVFLTIRPAGASAAGLGPAAGPGRAAGAGPAAAGTASPSGRSHHGPEPVIPETLTISVKTDFIDHPSQVADRLPKALIHHNVPGQPVHDWLTAMDRAWHTAAGIGSFSAKQRWIAMCSDLRAHGLPVLHGPARWRLGEITVPWGHVAPSH